ncbi:hypothetical protein MYX82_05150 [Acidobacteria bacterium AH-259-D05]|nr:hypothetical protein [Acidobacteria bacterium AH-259-D05]
MKVNDLAFHARGEIGGLCAVLMDELTGLVPPDNPGTDLEVEGFLLPGVHCRSIRF